jgi:hypothetical protein
LKWLIKATYEKFCHEKDQEEHFPMPEYLALQITTQWGINNRAQ